MNASRRTQPYRRNTGRPKGPALDAMLRGRDAAGRNPMDVQRKAQRAARKRKPAQGMSRVLRSRLGRPGRL